MMRIRVVAVCTEAAGEAVAEAVGVEPLMSPPLQAGELCAADLEEADVLYFRLHELPGVDDVWFGETASPEGGLIPAMRLELLERVSLPGVVVIIGNCYSASSKFVRAFYAAGARAVVAGPGENMAAANAVRGTDLLAKWIIGGLRRRLLVQVAVAVARARVRATGWRKSDRDAAEFGIIAN